MNTMQVERAFRMSKVRMLTTCGVVCERAIVHLAKLVVKKASFADPYFPDLKQKIRDAFSNILGVNNAAGLISSTEKLLGKKDEILTDAADFKVQVEQELRNDRSKARQYLTQLGFNQYYHATKTKQTELVELLFSIQNNIAPIETDLLALGVDKSCIDRLKAYAHDFNEAQIAQETMKVARKGETAEDLIELNDIYNEVYGASLMIQKFFKKNKVLRSEFSFMTIAANMQGGIFEEDENEETPEPETPIRKVQHNVDVG